MTVRGTLRADGLVVARIDIDSLVSTPKVHCLAALVHTEGGQTLAWTEGEGAMWSADTMKKLQELRNAMERDMAARLFLEMQSPTESVVTDNVGGLGEHVGEPPDAPSV